MYHCWGGGHTLFWRFLYASSSLRAVQQKRAEKKGMWAYLTSTCTTLSVHEKDKFSDVFVLRTNNWEKLNVTHIWVFISALSEWTGKNFKDFVIHLAENEADSFVPATGHIPVQHSGARWAQVLCGDCWEALIVRCGAQLTCEIHCYNILLRGMHH